MKLHYLSFALAVGALAACDASAPTAVTTASPRLDESRAVLASTNGGGQAILPPGFSALRFSFTAEAHADGSASGQFRQFYESDDGTVDFHGEVTCVTFDPVNHRAWIGGVITQNNSTDAAAQTPIHQVGKDVWFRVVDYGEGQSPADRTTVFGFEGGGGIGTSAEYCAVQLWRESNTWEVFAGNIQVRE